MKSARTASLALARPGHDQNVSLTGGVDNVFDKRQWRAGNAQTTGNATTGAYMYGAGLIPIMSRAARGI